MYLHMKLFFASITLAALLGLVKSVEKNNLSVSIPAVEWFSSLDRKPTPIYLCEGFTEGTLYRIPPLRKCQLPNNPANSSIVNITVWWEDISNQDINAYECYGVVSVVECSWGPIQGCVYTFHPNERKYMTPEMCWVMIKKLFSPDGRKMKRIREGYWGTDDQTLPEGKWFSKDKVARINYFARTLKMSVSNVDQRIMTLAGILKTCYGYAGSCETNQGFIVWDKDQIKKCRMREGASTACLRTDDTVSCPDIGLSLSGVEKLLICNCSIAYSKEGIYFSVEGDDEFLVNFTSTAEVKRIVQSKRKKRDTTFVTTSQYNSRTHFIYDMVEKKLEGEVQLLHHEMCKLSQNVQANMRYYAENGDPNMMIGSILFDGKYKSRLHGDAVALWKCHEIWNYNFLMRENCTREWPVKYLHNHDQYLGWIRPVSHEITQFSTATQCPVDSFYFDTGNETLLLSEKAYVHNIPYVPSMYEGPERSIHAESTAAFSAKGFFTASDINQYNSIYRMERSEAENVMVHNVIKKREKGIPLSHTEQLTIDAVERIAIDKVYSHAWLVVYGMIAGVICIVLVLLICFRKRLFGGCCGRKTNGNEHEDIEMKVFNSKSGSRNKKNYGPSTSRSSGQECFVRSNGKWVRCHGVDRTEEPLPQTPTAYELSEKRGIHSYSHVKDEIVVT